MTPRKLLVVGILAGLVVATLGFEAQAKKKKKKPPAPVPSEQIFFLRHESDECDDESKFVLSLVDGEDTDCGHTGMPLNELSSVTGMRAEWVYNTGDGVPLTLDATRPVKGLITMRNFNGVGAGQAELDLILNGTAGGQTVEIGLYETSYITTPQTATTIEYEIAPPANLDKLVFDSLSLVVFPHGVTVGIHGVVEHDTPPPTLTVPTLEVPK